MEILFSERDEACGGCCRPWSRESGIIYQGSGPCRCSPRGFALLANELLHPPFHHHRRRSGHPVSCRRKCSEYVPGAGMGGWSSPVSTGPDRLSRTLAGRCPVDRDGCSRGWRHGKPATVPRGGISLPASERSCARDGTDALTDRNANCRRRHVLLRALRREQGVASDALGHRPEGGPVD